MSKHLVSTILLAGAGLLFRVVPGCTARPATTPTVEPTAPKEDGDAVFRELLARHVSVEGVVDYEGWRASADDMAKLERYTKRLLEASPGSAPDRFPDASARLGYWINLYNALSLRAILRRWPVESLEAFGDRGAGHDYGRGLLYDLQFDVAGEQMSLLDIETAIIRNQYEDVRALFALHCGAESCPLLPPAPFDGASLDRRLEEATRAFVNRADNVAVHESQKTVVLSPVLGWYQSDLVRFIGQREEAPAPSLFNFLLAYAGPELSPALQKARDRRYRITFRPYDWRLHRLEPSADPPAVHGEEPSLDGTTPLPSMELRRLDGSTWSSASAKGKVTLIDFWATWCRPCLLAFPRYAELQLAYEKQGFAVVAVAQDESEAPVEAFVEANHTAIDVVLDPEHVASGAPLNVSTLPTVLLVDREGVVRHRHQGYSQPDLDQLKLKIEALLAEDPTQAPD